jgi:hypothetical protein
MGNNMLKTTDMLYAWQIADGLGKCWPGRTKEEKEEEAPQWLEKELERVMKQKNVAAEGAVAIPTWRNVTEKQ